MKNINPVNPAGVGSGRSSGDQDLGDPNAGNALGDHFFKMACFEQDESEAYDAMSDLHSMEQQRLEDNAGTGLEKEAQHHATMTKCASRLAKAHGATSDDLCSAAGESPEIRDVFRECYGT